MKKSTIMLKSGFIMFHFIFKNFTQSTFLAFFPYPQKRTIGVNIGPPTMLWLGRFAGVDLPSKCATSPELPSSISPGHSGAKVSPVTHNLQPLLPLRG